MEITDLHKFAKAFYYAAKAYFYHRFNILASDSYFTDALYHYYHNEIQGKFDTFSVYSERMIRYYTNSAKISTTIFDVKLCLGFDEVTEISFEKFALQLIGDPTIFPPIKRFITFPKRNYPNNFEEIPFKIKYPSDLRIFAHLSYDIEFLRQWLNNATIDEKIAFILGYNSGIQKTLTRFLPNNLNYVAGEVEEELYRYLLTGKVTIDMKSQYGNYVIRKHDFTDILSITSNAKFANPVERILPGKQIANVRLEPIYPTSKLLGSGSNGRVYDTYNPQLVSKIFGYDDYESFYAELESFQVMKRYIISFTNVSQILYYDEVKKILQLPRLYPLPERVNPFVTLDGKLPIFLQIIRGLYSMHSCGIAHNDIKLFNVLQTDASEVQLIDFGLSQSYCVKPIQLVQGTFIYNPPEINLPNQYPNILDNPEWMKLSPAHDIWSAVVTAYELLIGQTIHSLVTDLNDDEIMLQIMQCLGTFSSSGRLPKLFDLIGDDSELLTVLKSCVHFNPFQRATALEILQSPYAQRHLINFTPLNISPCLHQQIVDSNPFAGYRSQEERENWIVLCQNFNLNGVEYAPMFECQKLPKVLGYLDYLAILFAAQKEKKTPLIFYELPHPQPLSHDGYSHDLNKLTYKYLIYFIGISPLSLFKQHSRSKEILKIVTAGYLAGKCEYHSVLELLSE